MIFHPVSGMHPALDAAVRPAVESFLVLKQLSGQSSTLFLLTIVDKILQTMLVVTTAAVQHFRT